MTEKQPKTIIDPRRSILLIPMPNGGWVVEQPHGNPQYMPAPIGAYSCPEHMLVALREALSPLHEAANVRP